MSDLSPELQNLVLAGKAASSPTIADFDRVRIALQARLGDVVFPNGEFTPATGSNGLLHTASSKVIGLTAVGLALVLGSFALYASRHREDQAGSITPVATEARPTGATAEPPQPLIPPNREAQSSTPTTTEPLNTSKYAPVVASNREPTRNRDNFAEEVALLSRAEAELHRGRPAKALELLSEHERNFANGALVEERMAARIQAFCALGRVAEAEAQLARLKPGSLHGKRSRNACEVPLATKAK